MKGYVIEQHVIKQLGAIYRRHALDRIVVITPTRQIGRNLQGWLADSGTPHGNIRFEDVGLFARQLAEADTSRALPDVASRDLLMFVAADAVASAGRKPGFYFGSSTGPGFVRVVERTLSSLREAGVTPDLLSGSPRLASVGLILDDYVRTLQRLRLSDGADIFRLATGFIKRSNGQVGIDVLCVLGETRLTPAAEEMLRTLAPSHRYRVGQEAYEHEPPARTALRRLADWPTAGGSAVDGRIPRMRVVTAPSPEREIEGILADILAAGLRWDQCELAYTNADYLSTIESVADALEIPCTFARGRPAAATAAGQALIEFYRTSAEGGESLSKLVAEGIRLLDRDRAASTSLKERMLALAETEFVSNIAMSSDAAAALMVDLVKGHHYQPSAARAGELYVVPLDGSGYTGRPHTFIVGLDEHVFPGSTHEDPVLLDQDRRTISAGLPLRHADSGERIWGLERALGAVGESATLVGKDLDLIYGKHIALSPAIVTLVERHGLDVESYGLVETAERSLSVGALLLSQRDATGYAELVNTTFPWLDQGWRAAEMRLRIAMNEYTGFLGRPTPELSIRGEKAFSASAMERLAGCPYRHFLRQVLGVRKPDEPAVGPGQWLDAREFGILLHDLLRRFMTRLKESGERADADRHAGWMTELVDEVVTEMELERPAPSATARDYDRMRLERSAMIFLRNESRAKTEPIAFELSFGLGDDDPLEVVLDGTMTLRLRGTIDRVDRVADGYEVWDYKSGSTAPFDEDDLTTTTGHLQWMLYAYAFEELRAIEEPDARVVRSGYYFVSDRENGRRLVAPVRDRQQLARDLRPLAALTEAGAFPHFQKGKPGGSGPQGACKFCDYKAICWEERRTRKDLDDLEMFERSSSVGRELEEWLS